jgi:hypothetical protein
MVQAKKPRRQVAMACTKNATLWLTETGATFIEGVGATLGAESTVDAVPYVPAAGMKIKVQAV